MPRRNLTRADIVIAAMSLVESDGVDGLTMRGLADRLGVSVTSIYWHVGSKSDLELAMVSRIGPEIFMVRGCGTSQLAGLAHRLGRLEELLSPARRALAEVFAAAGLRGTRISDATNAVIQLVGDRATIQQLAAGWPKQRFEGPPLWEGKPPVGMAAARRLASPPDSEYIFNVALRALIRGLLSG